MSPAVSGSMKTIPIHRQIADIATEGLSGVLEVSRGRLKKQVSFSKGKPVAIISNSMSESLGRLLESTGRVTRKQVDDLRVQAKKLQKSIEAIVLEHDLVTKEELERLQAALDVLRLVSLYLWDDGTFAFKALSIPDGEALPIADAVNQMAKKQAAAGDLLPKLGARRHEKPMAVSDPPFPVESFGLEESALEFYKSLDGKRDMAEILAFSGVSPTDAALWLQIFTLGGLIQDANEKRVEAPSGAIASPPPSRPAVPKPAVIASPPSPSPKAREAASAAIASPPPPVNASAARKKKEGEAVPIVLVGKPVTEDASSSLAMGQGAKSGSPSARAGAKGADSPKAAPEAPPGAAMAVAPPPPSSSPSPPNGARDSRSALSSGVNQSPSIAPPLPSSGEAVPKAPPPPPGPTGAPGGAIAAPPPTASIGVGSSPQGTPGSASSEVDGNVGRYVIGQSNHDSKPQESNDIAGLSIDDMISQEIGDLADGVAIARKVEQDPLLDFDMSEYKPKERDLANKFKEDFVRLHKLNYFELFNVDRRAKATNIRKAYFVLVKEYHTDKLIGLPEPVQKLGREIFNLIQKAYDTLTEQEAREKYVAATFYGKADEEEAAIEEVQTVLQADQHYRTGIGLLNAGNLQGAHAAFARAREVYPKEPEYNACYGYTLFRLGYPGQKEKVEEGEKLIQDALRVNKKLDRAYLYLGRIYTAKGNYQMAARYYVRALKINPTNLDAGRELQQLKGRKEQSETGLLGSLFGKFKRS